MERAYQTLQKINNYEFIIGLSDIVLLFILYIFRIMKTLVITLVSLSVLLLTGCTKTAPTITTTTTDEVTTWATTIAHEENEAGGHVSTEEWFIVGMIPHHQEAVSSAQVILEKSENAKLKIIAQAIVDTQSKEIVQLQGRLQARYPTSTVKADYMAMMRDLSKLSWHELDDAFMEDMIKHHEEAIHEATEVLEVSQRPEIVTLANDVIDLQSSEITEFQKLLDAKDRH